jgi:16S rRNA (cytidine1402-2'-O)-methyltransferase
MSASSKNKGKLYLIPCPIHEDNAAWVGEDIKELLSSLKYYTVEKGKTARRFIKMMQPQVVLQDLIMEEFDKADPSKGLKTLIQPCLDGHDMGLMSEAGNPCIADPGSLLVGLAHDLGIEVIPMVGPSSILMALIASGFNGQNFTFHGYLPNKKEQLAPRLKSIEQSAMKYHQTQIFMETPYRNEFIIGNIISTLQPTTRLTIAANIGGKDQSILTKAIKDWANVDLLPYHKIPCLFVIGKF